MSYDNTKPLDTGYLADAPAELRANFKGIIEDKIVNAAKLNDLEAGNASGGIPVSNGTLNVNLNADMLDGFNASDFAAASHEHAGATSSAAGFITAAQVQKLEGISDGAEVNQNAFAKVAVGNTNLVADSKDDTLTVTAGTGITLTPNAENDSFSIGVTANTYAAKSHTHNYAGSSSAGGTANSANKLIPNAGVASLANDTTAKWAELGTCVAWLPSDKNTVNSKPADWLIVLNIHGGASDVWQLAHGQSDGDIFYRGGNNSGWGCNNTTNWKRILSTGNYKTYVTPASIGAAAASHGTHVPGIKSANTFCTLGWGTNNNYVPDISLLAYWNGCYSGNISNLQYCDRGRFGTIVTKASGDYLGASATAAAATKLATARNITVKYGSSQGTASFNGTSAITISMHCSSDYSDDGTA